MLPKPVYPVPHRAGVIGIWVFLAALTMLFASSLLGYFLIRLTGENTPPVHSIHLPPALWASTAVILLSSLTIQRALAAIRRQKRRAFLQSLVTTAILAVVFVAIQFPSMVALLREHRAQADLYNAETRLTAPTVVPALRSAEPVLTRTRPRPFYGLICFLVLVHALHVLGGLVFLAMVLHKAVHNGYDHEHHAGVRNVTVYWHFLDVVWLVMFLTMWSVG